MENLTSDACSHVWEVNHKSAVCPHLKGLIYWYYVTSLVSRSTIYRGPKRICPKYWVDFGLDKYLYCLSSNNLPLDSGFKHTRSLPRLYSVWSNHFRCTRKANRLLPVVYFIRSVDWKQHQCYITTPRPISTVPSVVWSFNLTLHFLLPTWLITDHLGFQKYVPVSTTSTTRFDASQRHW